MASITDEEVDLLDVGRECGWLAEEDDGWH